MRLRSPIRWFGGKGEMVVRLLPLLPPHSIYVEPFGGGASLLFAKEPSPVEVYNDLDSGLVNFFRVLRDSQKFARFYHLATLTPYSREEYYFCRETWEDCEDEVERAYRWFVVARGSFSGRFGSGWAYTVSASSAKQTSKWISILGMLPAIHGRMMQVQIEHDDFARIIERYDAPETLFYLDPPYIAETRRSGGYKHEMSIDDHKRLVEMLLNIKGKALLSGYKHDIYEPLEQAGWERRDFETACHAAGRTRGTGILGQGAAKLRQARVESVWISPHCKDAQLALC